MSGRRGRDGWSSNIHCFQGYNKRSLKSIIILIVSFRVWGVSGRRALRRFDMHRKVCFQPLLWGLTFRV